MPLNVQYYARKRPHFTHNSLSQHATVIRVSSFALWHYELLPSGSGQTWSANIGGSETAGLDDLWLGAIWRAIPQIAAMRQPG